MGTNKVSLTFCGGCNPRIERSCIADEVKGMLESRGYEVIYNNCDADFMVYLSGCQANCAVRYSHCALPSVAVAANTVDMQLVEEEEISIHIIRKVREYFEQLERTI